MRRAVLAVAVLFFACQVASAATREWSVTTGNWSSASNWGGAEPTSSDVALIRNRGTATITATGEHAGLLVIGDADAGAVEMTGGSLIVDELRDGNGGTGEFTQSAGTTSVNGVLQLGYGTPGNGTYNLTGSGTLYTGGESIGYYGAGSFDQSGGSHNVSGSFVMAYQPGSRGEYDLSDGSFRAGNEMIGLNGSAQFSQSGGSHTASSIRLANGGASRGVYDFTGGILILGGLTKGTGTALFNFGGGTLRAGANFASNVPMTLTGVGGDAIVDTVNYVLSFSGELSGPGGLVKSGAGTLALATDNSYTGGTIVKAGTLQVGNANALGTGGLTVTGGTVDLNGYGITIPSLNGKTSIITDNKADTRTTILTVASSADSNYTGVIQDGSTMDVGLTKAGSGSMTLGGANTYTGTTTVVGGTLLVTGSLSSAGAVVVDDGGTLGGSGSVGGVTVSAGGHLAPGTSAGVLTLYGDLKLDLHSVLDFDLDTPSTSDMVLLPSSALYMKSLDLDDFSFTLLDDFGVGTYTLIDAAHILGDLGPNLTGNLGGYSAVLSVAGDDLVLNVTGAASVPEPATWTLLIMGAAGLFVRRRTRTLSAR